MENQQTISEEQAIAEILENTRKTKNYMKWQLIITVAMVVVPLIAVLAILPMVLSSVAGAGGLGDSAGVLQSLQ